MDHRFLHAADLHLDSPFRGLGRERPELAQRLRDASLKALSKLVDEAIRLRCHFVLVAGDVYDGLERGVRAQLHLQRSAQRLSDAGIHLVILHGNHDPSDEGYTAVTGWPEHTHFLRRDEPDVLELETPAGRVTITGQSYPTKKVHHNLAAGYPEPVGAGLHVAMLHTQLVSDGGTHPYSPTTLDVLTRTGFHYWALGHVHEQRVLHAGSPVVAYPGNPQGRHFREAGPRGALFVEGPPNALHPRAIPLAEILFESVPLDVSSLQDLAQIPMALLEALPDRDADLLLRAELSGRSQLFEGLQDEDNLAAMLSQLDERSPAGVTWLEVRSNVQPDLDLASLGQGATLADALTRNANDWKGASKGARKALLAVKGLRRLAKSLDEDELNDLVDRALMRAVSAVHPGASS